MVSKKRTAQAKADFTKDSVNHVNSWYHSGYCAIVSWGGWVRLFSILDRAFVRNIFTKKNAGGLSVAMSSDDVSGAARGNCFLLHWDEQTGRIMRERAIPDAMHGEICQQGSTMFLIDYKTYECSLEPIS